SDGKDAKSSSSGQDSSFDAMKFLAQMGKNHFDDAARDIIAETSKSSNDSSRTNGYVNMQGSMSMNRPQLQQSAELTRNGVFDSLDLSSSFGQTNWPRTSVHESKYGDNRGRVNMMDEDDDERGSSGLGL